MSFEPGCAGSGQKRLEWGFSKYAFVGDRCEVFFDHVMRMVTLFCVSETWDSEVLFAVYEVEDGEGVFAEPLINELV